MTSRWENVVMQFFVPGASADEAENVYAALAELCGIPAPRPGERIQSITFPHDSEEWTATVGQRLEGTRTDRRKRGGRTVDVTTRLRSPVTVQAIFPGIPYQVVTDGPPLGSARSAWANPFFAAQEESIRRITYFEPPQEPAAEEEPEQESTSS